MGTDSLDNPIYAQLTALKNFTSPDDSGADNNDIIVSLRKNNTAELKLSLYSDASYSTLYAPSQSFSWTATFADIEGTNSPTIDAYESITLHTAGSYTLATDTALTVTANEAGTSTTFSGQGTPTVTNPTSDLLTQAQGTVAVAYTLTDTAEMLFDYYASESNRNLWVDVGNLQFSTTTKDYNVGSIPEPASAGLLLGAFGISMALLRRKRT